MSAMSIGYALSLDLCSIVKIFNSGTTVLKRAYGFASKVEFSKLIQPHCQMTAETVAEYDVVLCVGV